MEWESGPSLAWPPQQHEKSLGVNDLLPCWPGWTPSLPCCNLRTAPGTYGHYLGQAPDSRTGIPRLERIPCKVWEGGSWTHHYGARLVLESPGITKTRSIQSWIALSGASCAIWRHPVAVPEAAPGIPRTIWPEPRPYSFALCLAHASGNCKNENDSTYQSKVSLWLNLLRPFTLFTLFPPHWAHCYFCNTFGALLPRGIYTSCFL